MKFNPGTQWKHHGGKNNIHIFDHTKLPFMLENKGNGNVTLFNTDDNEIFLNIPFYKAEKIVSEYYEDFDPTK